MALGSYDANGIWHYGESDNIALFSDTLNKLADSASSAFTADRARLATLEAGSLSGLIPVKPTSVVVAGGTAATNSLGVVSFTNATALSLNGIFTSAYSVYKMIIFIPTASAAGQCAFRFRSSGTDNSSSNYYQTQFLSRITGTTQTNSGGPVTFGSLFGWLGAISNDYQMLVVDISNPMKAMKKNISGIAVANDGTSLYQSMVLNLFNGNTLTFDGFTIYPTAGTFTGSVQILAYNN